MAERSRVQNCRVYPRPHGVGVTSYSSLKEKPMRNLSELELKLVSGGDGDGDGGGGPIFSDGMEGEGEWGDVEGQIPYVRYQQDL